MQVTKKEKELRELQFSRIKYDVIPTAEMAKRVSEVESILSEPLTIWGDEHLMRKYQLINSLNLSDKRLLIVYSLLDGSLVKTAAYFGVSKKTIATNISRIKSEMGLENDMS